MPKQPTLPTARLQLLPAEPAWARAVLDFQLRNRSHFKPWDPTPGDMFFTELFWSMRLKRCEEEWRDDRGACFLLMREEEPGRVIGMVTLSNVVRGVFQACHLGYKIDAAHEGKGLMREALQAVLRFAFEHMKLHRVQANYQAANLRSGGLLSRLGFTVEGQARDYLFLDGAWRDHVLSALINPDFDASALRV